MNKYFTKNISLIKYMFYALLLAMAVSYIEIRQDQSIKYISDLFINNYGKLQIGYLNINILQLIKWLTIHLVLILLLYNYISEDFGKFSQFIFTRTNKRIKWFLKKALNLATIILIFYLIQFFGSLIVGMMHGMYIGDIYSIIKSIFIFSIYMTLVIISINILNILIDTRFSIILILFIEITPILILDFLIKIGVKLYSLVKLIPSINAFVITNIDNKDTILTLHDKYSYIFSYSYVFILILIIIGFGSMVVNKVDLLGGNE